MKNFLLTIVLIPILIMTPVFASYQSTSDDELLLSSLQPKIDRLWETNPSRLATIFTKVELLTATIQEWTRLHYLLSEIHISMQSALAPLPPSWSALSSAVFDEISKKSDVIVIDLRTDQELLETWVIAQIDEQKDVYIPTRVEELEELDPSQTYLLYCRSGNRSGRITDRLADLWFTSVYDLDGWIWQRGEDWYSLVNWE